MLPTFVIGLREGLEAALIVAIIGAFLRKQGRMDALRAMWLGVGAAVVLCVAVGVLLQVLNHDLPEGGQQILEATVAIVAVVMVSLMIVWMRRHGRHLASELRSSAADALADEIRLAKKAQEEEARKALQEAARARLEAQTRAEVQAKAKADAQRQTQMAGETSQYLAEVKARVEHAWNRPASAKKGVQCTLEVDQAPTGTVLQARVINPCNGDEAVRASIRDAALRASPLPVPQNRDLFQRTLHLVFSPDD